MWHPIDTEKQDAVIEGKRLKKNDEYDIGTFKIDMTVVFETNETNAVIKSNFCTALVSLRNFSHSKVIAISTSYIWHVYLHNTYILTALDIKKNNAIQILETWGPDYKVEFSIRVMKTPDGNKEYNILHITDDQKQYQNLLVSAKNGSLHISSIDENVIFKYQYETSYEYDIIIQQSGKLYIYKFVLNQLIALVWKCIFILFAEICAILYGNQNYDGWNFKVPEINSENLLGQHDNHVSSIKLRDGCIFSAYSKADNESLMFITNDDMEHLDTFDDQISSFSCECTTSKG